MGADDEAGLYRLWNDPDVRRYLWDDSPVPREMVKDQIESSQRSFSERGFGHFSVSLPPDEPLIGASGQRTIADSADVEVLYALFPRYWGSGLATEAARATIRFGFEEVRLTEIFAGADPPNAASFRVMERLPLHGERRIGGLTARYYRIRREDFSPDAGAYPLRRKE